MKILFITKPYVIDPLGIAYLSAALKKDGHTVELMRITDVSIRDIVRIRPDVLAYSVYTGRHNLYLEINRKIRRALAMYNQYPVSAFGGSHPTFFSDVANEVFVDVVCQGEFDLLVSETFAKAVSGEILPHTIIKPDANPQDLDLLPFPDRDLIYQFPENRDNPIKNIMTSRGCPFACPYCYNSVFNEMFEGKTIRYRSIDSVIEEALCLVKDYPQTKYIFFVDDEFVGKMSRVTEFSKKWKEMVGLPFHVQLRVDLLTEPKVALLRDAGCTSITFAIETGNVDKRYKLLDRRISNEMIINAADLLHRYGISFRTENMLALPNETIDEALETLDLNIACNPTIGWSSLFQPYPGTPLGDISIGQGLFDGKLENIPSTFFEKSVLNIPEDQKRRFENLQRLFGFVCDFPFLRFFIKFLISMPRNKLYNFIYSWHKQWRYSKLFS